MTARVSVIIPTYNRASLVVEAIQSVLGQSFGNYEIIVANHGSTDETAARLAALSGPIRCLAMEQTGRPAVPRNQAIRMAQGEFLAFLDDDDLWHPHYLERQVALLDENGEIGLTYAGVRYLYPDGALGEPDMAPYYQRANHLFDHLLDGCFIYPSMMVVRRTLVERVGLFDEGLPTGEDYDFILRLAYATRAGCITEPLVIIRRHPASVSQQAQSRSYQAAAAVLEQFMARNPLKLRQRWRGRLAVSRFYTHVGLAELASGRPALARRHFRHSLRAYPWQRRAWVAWIASYRNQ
ncbi:MAG: glycosyltransferase [Chloroflexota bacterium]